MEKNLNPNKNRKDSYTEVFLKAAGLDHDEKSVIEFKNRLWCSKRNKDHGGLQMTDECLDLVENKCQIKTYEIKMPKELVLSSQVIIWLDNYIDTPWHLDKEVRKLKVLSERTAFELYLFAGDIKKYGMAKTMSKRLSQESSST